MERTSRVVHAKVRHAVVRLVPARRGEGPVASFAVAAVVVFFMFLDRVASIRVGLDRRSLERLRAPRVLELAPRRGLVEARPAVAELLAHLVDVVARLFDVRDVGAHGRVVAVAVVREGPCRRVVVGRVR